MSVIARLQQWHWSPVRGKLRLASFRRAIRSRRRPTIFASRLRHQIKISRTWCRRRSFAFLTRPLLVEFQIVGIVQLVFKLNRSIAKVTRLYQKLHIFRKRIETHLVRRPSDVHQLRRPTLVIFTRRIWSKSILAF